MKASRKAAAITAVSLICLIAVACGDAQELSATAIVLGIGIDDHAGQVELTVELSSADSSEALVLQAIDETVEACVKTILLSYYEYLYWGGTAAVIIDSSLTLEDMECYALFLYRDLGISGKTPVLKAWNCSSAEVLNGSFGHAPFISVGIGEALRIKEEGISIRYLTLAELIEDSIEQKPTQYMAAVTIDEKGHVRMVDVAG